MIRTNARSGRFTWLVPMLLALAYATSMVDRYILFQAIDPVKAQFGLSDTQMGLLVGFGFSLFYAVLGLFLGRLADTTNRRNLIVAGIVFWSIMTAMTGAARTVWQLFIARVGVAAGEASLVPSAYSMVGDIFDKERVPRAISIIYTGVALGPGLALLLGGFLFGFFKAHGPIAIAGLAPFAVWQSVMIAAGIPGLIVAALILAFVREPVRQRAPAGDTRATIPSATPGLFAWFWSQRSFYASLFGAMTAMSIYANGLAAWMPTFFDRRFGWSVAEVGPWLGVMLAISGTSGTLSASWVGERIRRSGHADASMRLVSRYMVLLLPLGLFATIAPLPLLSVGLLIPLFVVLNSLSATAPAVLQIVTPPALRGRMTALYLGCFGLISNGVGPLLVGVFTDRLFHRPDKVGLSLALLAAITLPFSALLCRHTLRAFQALIAREEHALLPLKK